MYISLNLGMYHERILQFIKKFQIKLGKSNKISKIGVVGMFGCAHHDILQHTIHKTDQSPHIPKDIYYTDKQQQHSSP
jgi:hypothetical protein